MGALAALGMEAASEAAGSAMGLIAGGIQQKRNFKYNKKMLAEQTKANKEMADYQQRLQLGMWEKTGYGGQMEQLKKAGLNPALLYGQGGGGGQSIGAGVGNVSSPNMSMSVPSGDMANALKTAAEIELVKAQKDNVQADTDRKTGVDKDKVVAETNSIIQGINNQKAQERLTKAEAGIKEVQLEVDQWGVEQYKAMINVSLWRAKNAWEKEVTEKTITQETADDAITIMEQQAIGSKLENELIKGKTALTLQQVKESKEQINKWAQEVAQGWKKLDIESQNSLINYLNYEVNNKNATTNSRNADSNSRNSQANMINAESNHGNMLTNAGRLELEKWLKDTPDSWKLGVETVGGIVKGVLGGSKGKK